MGKSWSIEDFKKALLESRSISEALRKIGLPEFGGSYLTARRCIKEYNIDISHMLKSNNGCKNKFIVQKTKDQKMQKPLKYFLVDGIIYRTATLKKRLIKEKILKNECSICGQQSNWNGKNLIMILDHINGKNTDNRKENIRLVCPNCNTQLSTFCGRKNKGLKLFSKIKIESNKCYFCKKEISRNAKYCMDCYRIDERKIIDRPSYSQLIEDKKSMSMLAIGKKYGVSDNSVRKWIRSYEKDLEKISQQPMILLDKPKE